MKAMYQKDKYSSPWPLSLRIKKFAWDIVWGGICRPTPKPLNFFRVFIFKLFGGVASEGVFIHQSARIHFPWNVTLRKRACLGERVWVYSVGNITIGADATVAQETFLCTATHDFKSIKRELFVGSIHISDGAFIAARVILLPNTTVGINSIVGAGSVVTKSIEEGTLYAGNPAQLIRHLI